MTQIAGTTRKRAGTNVATTFLIAVIAWFSSAVAAEEFSLVKENPVLKRGVRSNFDGMFIDPGAVTFHDGKFHLLYSALPGWPHPL